MSHSMSFDPDLRAVAELSRRSLPDVRAEFDSIISRRGVREAARIDRRKADAGPGIPIPTVGEFAARIAIRKLKEASSRVIWPDMTKYAASTSQTRLGLKTGRSTSI